MYRTPTLPDFQRNIDTIMHDGEHAARAEFNRVQSEYITKGMANSTSLIGAVAGSLDQVHTKAIRRTMELMSEFNSSQARISLDEYSKTIRDRCGNLANMLLSTVPAAGFPEHREQIRKQYRAVFQQRLDGALRDIEVGFVSGRNIVSPIKDADRRGAILQRFYDQRHQKGWVGIPSDGIASLEEKIVEANICQQLGDNGLIEWKRAIAGEPNGMGRITALGVDVVEGDVKSPISVSRLTSSAPITPPLSNVQTNFFGSNFSNIRFGAETKHEIPLATGSITLPTRNTPETSNATVIMRGELSEVIRRLDVIEKGFRDILPLISAIEAKPPAHGEIGHNNPPEPITMVTRGEIEDAIEAATILRGEIQFEQPRANVLRLCSSVLKRAIAGITSLSLWTAGQGKVFVEEFVKEAGKTAGKHVTNTLLATGVIYVVLSDLQTNGTEIIQKIQQLIGHLH